MPSDSAHPARGIVELVGELEASAAAADGALVERDWGALEAALSEQRRITHAVANAVALTRGARPAAFDDELRRRLAAVEAQRAGQLRRLEAFHAAVGTRLSVIARAKAMRRASNPPDAIQPALLNSLR